jgi:hypothetical protein
MQQIELPAPEAAILTRLVDPEEPKLTSAAAEGILTIAFSSVDKDRMNVLAAKSRSGKLTTKEKREIEAYSRVSSLLGILKSKARRILKRRKINGTAKTH